jgi:hypothetical protein
LKNDRNELYLIMVRSLNGSGFLLLSTLRNPGPLLAHNPKVTGSNPVPATNVSKRLWGFPKAFCYVRFYHFSTKPFSYRFIPNIPFLPELENNADPLAADRIQQGRAYTPSPIQGSMLVGSRSSGA